MAIIKKYNAKNGTTYVYDSVSYWDKELKQPRSKRKLIGKIDPATGQIVPTAGRGRKPKKDIASEGETQQQVPASPALPDSPDSPVSNEPEPARMDETELRLRYEECRRKLLETEAALAKAQSTVARLTSEKQELRQELEQLLRRLSR